MEVGKKERSERIEKLGMVEVAEEMEEGVMGKEKEKGREESDEVV